MTQSPRGDTVLAIGVHTENSSVIKRLKRATGHLQKVIEMLESQTDCMKVAQQLQAVSSAIIGAKKTYIHDHIDHCLSSAGSNRISVKVDEFKEITKYL